MLFVSQGFAENSNRDLEYHFHKGCTARGNRRLYRRRQTKVLDNKTFILFFHSYFPGGQQLKNGILS